MTYPSSQNEGVPNPSVPMLASPYKPNLYSKNFNLDNSHHKINESMEDNKKSNFDGYNTLKLSDIKEFEHKNNNTSSNSSTISNNPSPISRNSSFQTSTPPTRSPSQHLLNLKQQKLEQEWKRLEHISSMIQEKEKLLIKREAHLTKLQHDLERSRLNDEALNKKSQRLEEISAKLKKREDELLDREKALNTVETKYQLQARDLEEHKKELDKKQEWVVEEQKLYSKKQAELEEYYNHCHKQLQEQSDKRDKDLQRKYEEMQKTVNEVQEHYASLSSKENDLKHKEEKLKYLLNMIQSIQQRQEIAKEEFTKAIETDRRIISRQNEELQQRASSIAMAEREIENTIGKITEIHREARQQEHNQELLKSEIQTVLSQVERARSHISDV
mmetsp:Transcript_194/g.334  ORF Transcript_194/g.334 Transcript_194/m.334 type:complete len:387 (-) Transcript_194:39-1199(-)